MFDGCEILQRLGFFLLDPSDIPTYLGLSDVAGGSKFSSELLPKKKGRKEQQKAARFPKVREVPKWIDEIQAADREFGIETLDTTAVKNYGGPGRWCHPGVEKMSPPTPSIS